MKNRFAMMVIIFAGLGLYAKSSPTSPKEIVEQFVKMDVQGERLTAQGWRTADAFFVEHRVPFEPKVIVVIGRNYAVSTPTEKVNANEFYFGYEEVGRISASSLRFVPTKSGIQSRTFDKYEIVSSPAGGTSSGWRIAGAQPETMHLIAAAAIRWIAEKRSKTTDISIQGNADQALRRLAPFR